MKTRRKFLEDAAKSAAVLSSAAAMDKLSLADVFAPGSESGKSKVIIARDPGIQTSGAQPDEQRVQALLDRAMAAYSGRQKPVEAWKHALPPGALDGKVIGLKVNGLGGKGIATHPALILAVVERLQQAGVKPGNIVVWDQNARFLGSCGMTISTDPSRMRCYPSDAAGFEEQESSWGSVRIRLTKILTRDCDLIINMPILKDHELAGVTFALKNMYGVVDKPFTMHASGCNPGVADLNSLPVFREKVHLTIGDAISSVYNGGPSFHPEHLWFPNTLMVGQDRVALDTLGWQMLEKKRAEMGMPTLEAAGRPPRYIATAADAAHGLGVNDPQHIKIVEV